MKLGYQQGSWDQHVAHLGPTGPRWAPCWPHELCYLGLILRWHVACLMPRWWPDRDLQSDRWPNTLRPRQNDRWLGNVIFKCIFIIKRVMISVKISPKFVPKGPIDNIPALIKIMALCRWGDKPLSKTMMAQFTDGYIRHWLTAIGL